MRNSLKHKFIIPDCFKRLSLNKKRGIFLIDNRFLVTRPVGRSA